jgi:TRAP-type uncharacterized transport system substrate-binding protein
MFESDSEAYGILQRILDSIQGNKRIRRALGALLFVLLLALVLYFISGLLPQKYTLTVSGGPLLSNRHHLMRILQREAGKYGLTLNIVPYSGSMEILEAVSDGDLDLAVIQGGLDRLSPNVAHVAALPSEAVHLLVKEPIDSIEQLRGKSVNLGSTGGGTRLVVRDILSFFGLNAGQDYVEKNNTDEQLYDLSPDQLPDAIAVISYVPSYLADYLINQRGYTLSDIPLSGSLGWRYSWAESSQIQDSTYSATKAVPSADLETVGVSPEIICNEFVDPGAIKKFLEVLYNSTVESMIRQPVQEEDGNSGSLYPLSAGTEAYMRRNDPIFSMDALDDIRNVFGSIMAGLSTLLVVFRWFKGGQKNKKEEKGSEISEGLDPEKPQDDEGKKD